MLRSLVGSEMCIRDRFGLGGNLSVGLYSYEDLSFLNNISYVGSLSVTFYDAPFNQNVEIFTNLIEVGGRIDVRMDYADFDSYEFTPYQIPDGVDPSTVNSRNFSDFGGPDLNIYAGINLYNSFSSLTRCEDLVFTISGYSSSTYLRRFPATFLDSDGVEHPLIYSTPGTSQVNQTISFAFEDINLPNLITARSIEFNKSAYFLNAWYFAGSFTAPNLTTITKDCVLQAKTKYNASTSVYIPNVAHLGASGTSCLVIADNVNLESLSSTYTHITTKIWAYDDLTMNNLTNCGSLDIYEPSDNLNFLSNLNTCRTLQIRGSKSNFDGLINANPSISSFFMTISDEALESNGYEALGCLPNPGLDSTIRGLLSAQHGFYLALWDEAYPNGKENCTEFTPPPTPVDRTPDSFNFTNLTNQNLDEFVDSEIIQLSGFERPLDVRVVSGSETYISVNYADFTSTQQFVDSGDYIQIRTKTPENHGESTSVFVGIGNTSTTWGVSTVDNQGPVVVNPIGDQILFIGDDVDIDVTNVFTDADGHDLTLSVLNLPGRLELLNGHIVGKLSLSDIGEYKRPYILADDGHGGKGIDRFTIFVYPHRLESPNGKQFNLIVDEDGNIGTEEQ